MGYGFYIMNGRPSGYMVLATCDRRGCNAEIDRGLAYRCGDPNEDEGCGLYFCPDHLGGVGPRGGCPHRGGPWGRTLSCMAEHERLDQHERSVGRDVCCDRAGHDGPHAWETA